MVLAPKFQSGVVTSSVQFTLVADPACGDLNVRACHVSTVCVVFRQASLVPLAYRCFGPRLCCAVSTLTSPILPLLACWGLTQVTITALIKGGDAAVFAPVTIRLQIVGLKCPTNVRLASSSLWPV